MGTFFKVLLIGFIVAIAGYMTLFLYVTKVVMSPAKPRFQAVVNYAQTVRYLTGGEERIASQPRELTIAVGEFGAGFSGVGVRVRGLRGEAIPLPLASGDTAFALFMYPFAPGQIYTVIDASCGIDVPDSKRGEDRSLVLTSWVKEVEAFSGPCVTPEASWPIFVRFEDRSDPQSVRRVTPNELKNGDPSDLRMVSVSVERTSKKPETKVPEILPWLVEVDTHCAALIEGPGRSQESIVLNRWDYSSDVPRDDRYKKKPCE